MLDFNFLKPFRSLGSYYIYDAFTNRISEVSRAAFILAKHYRILDGTQVVSRYSGSIGRRETVRAYKELCRKFGPMSGARRTMRLPPMAAIKEKLEHRLDRLTLFVTNCCNLNCRYCPYNAASSVLPDRRSSMSARTATRALTFFRDHSTRSRSLTISFSGGEPLIAFPLLKQCIASARRLMPDRTLTFNITTNATLLTRSMVRFFMSNEVLLVVSVDGPASIGGGQRVNARGKDSSAVVAKKLAMLRDESEDYFQRYVILNTVIDLGANSAAIRRYFLRRFGKECNFVPKSDAQGLREGLLKTRALRKKRVVSLLHSLRQHKLTSAEFPNIAPYAAELHALSVRRMRPLGRSIPPNGMCIPGAQLSVAPDGKIYTCYQLTYESRIGDLRHGFDYTKIRRLLMDYRHISSVDCSCCWAMRLCKLCLFHANINGYLDGARKREECDRFRQYMEDALTLSIYV